MRNKRNYLLLSIAIIAAVFAYFSFSSTSNIGEQNIFGGAKDGLTELQKDIIVKFREGNVPGLMEYVGEEISINIMKESDFYSKEEAENILLDFCQNYTTKKFLVKHYGVNQAGTSYYFIAELLTTNNEKYRVYISNNKTHLESIEITKPIDN